MIPEFDPTPLVPVTPNPATTEWVPLWNLNGGGATGGGGGSSLQFGTWLPIIGGIPPETGATGNEGETGQGYHFQQGFYIKIDRFVYLWAYTQFGTPAPGTTGTGFGKGTITGPLGVKNFPFRTSNIPMFFAGVNAYFSNMLTPSNKLSLTFYTEGNVTFGRIKQLIQNDNPEPLFAVDVNDATQFSFSVAYIAD